MNAIRDPNAAKYLSSLSATYENEVFHKNSRDWIDQQENNVGNWLASKPIELVRLDPHVHRDNLLNQGKSNRFEASATSQHNGPMSNLTREELDAKLAATEARMDARFSGMSSKLDATLAEMRADREANNIRFVSMANAINDIKIDLKSASVESTEQFKSVKGNVWGAAVATITVVGATLAIAIASFDSGRETSKNIEQATARMEKLQLQIEAYSKQTTSQPQSQK